MPTSRRRFLAATTATAAAAALSACSSKPRPVAEREKADAARDRRRVARLAHLTDTHTQPELRAADGLAACLAHVHAQPDRPDLILTGGDLIMDSFDHDEARTRLQWELFTKTLRDHAAIPIRHCLGNHDVWGWNKAGSKTTGTERLWGKTWACEVLGLERPYYAFDLAAAINGDPSAAPSPSRAASAASPRSGAARGAWRVIVLDSTYPDGEGYIARFDDAQHDFLERELAATPEGTHVLVLSHMPVLMVSSMLAHKDGIALERKLPASWTHVDAKRLVALFEKHPQVRACVSGHMHEIDRIDYQGVSYFCNGAVSGNWWKGRHKACDEGYALLDLYADGSIERTYTTFGWRA